MFTPFIIDTKAGQPADVRGNVPAMMNRVAAAGKRIERNEGIAEGVGG